MAITTSGGATVGIEIQTAAKSSRLNSTTAGTAGALGSQSGADTDEVIVPDAITSNNEGNLEASPSYVGRHFILRPICTLKEGGGIAALAFIAAGGAGYTNGTQTLTVSGGTSRNAATFSVEVVSGVVTSINNGGAAVLHGNYTVTPANPAATTGGGGAGCTLTVTYVDGEEIRFVEADASNTLTVHEDWINPPVSGEDWAVSYIWEDVATVTGCTLVARTGVFECSRMVNIGDQGDTNFACLGIAEGKAAEGRDTGSATNPSVRVTDGGLLVSGYLSGGVPINGGYWFAVQSDAGEKFFQFDDGGRFYLYDLQMRSALADLLTNSVQDTGTSIRHLQGGKFFNVADDFELYDWTVRDGAISSAVAGTNLLIVDLGTDIDGLILINTQGFVSVDDSAVETFTLRDVTFAGNLRSVYVHDKKTWKFVNPIWTVTANPTNLAVVFDVDVDNSVEELFSLTLVVVDSAGTAIASARIFVVETLLNDDIPYHIPTPISGVSTVDVLKRKWTAGGPEAQATADLVAVAATSINNDEGFTLRDSTATDVVFKFSVDGGAVTGQDVTIAIRATRGVLSLAVSAIGSGYSVSDTGLVLVGGTGTAATFDLSNVVVVDAQIEADYDGSGNNGTFNPGSGHNVNDVIDMDDGTTVVVDSEIGGAIDGFTVLNGGGSHSADNDTIVQVGTTGSGIDFDMTLGLNNQGVSDPITIATQGSYTVDPSSPAGHTGGSGSGATFDVTMDPIDASTDVAANCDTAIDARAEWTGALSSSTVTITQDLGNPPDGNQTNAETVTNGGFSLEDFTGGTYQFISEELSGNFGFRVFRYGYVPFVANTAMFAPLVASVSMTLDAALTEVGEFGPYDATKAGVGIVVNKHATGETDPRPLKVLNYDGGTGSVPTIGETMTQGSATGDVVEYLGDAVSGTLVLEDWNGTEFTDNQTIAGDTSSFSAQTDLVGGTSFYEEYTWLVDANSYVTTVVYDYLSARLSAHVHPNCIQSDGGVFTEYTAEAKSAAVGDVQLLPASPVTNDYFVFGDEESLPEKLVIDMSTGATTSTIDWEYWDGVTPWKTLTDVADETTNFTLTGEKAVTYTYPTDAAKLVGVYYIRANQSHAAPVGQPLATRVWSGRDFEAVHIWGTGDVNLPMITTPDGHKTERNVTRTEGVWIANRGAGSIDYFTADDGTQYAPSVLVTLSVHVVDEAGADIVGARAAIYEDNSGVVGAELMNEDTIAGGLATAQYLWSADQSITIRVRESPNQASGRYFPAFRTGTITNQGFTLDVRLSTDAIASVT